MRDKGRYIFVINFAKSKKLNLLELLKYPRVLIWFKSKNVPVQETKFIIHLANQNVLQELLQRFFSEFLQIWSKYVSATLPPLYRLAGIKSLQQLS